MDVQPLPGAAPADTDPAACPTCKGHQAVINPRPLTPSHWDATIQCPQLVDSPAGLGACRLPNGSLDYSHYGGLEKLLAQQHDELRGTHCAFILGATTRRVPVRQLFDTLWASPAAVEHVLVDGLATDRLVAAAARLGCRSLLARGGDAGMRHGVHVRIRP